MPNEEAEKLATNLQTFDFLPEDLIKGSKYSCLSYAKCLEIAETILKDYKPK
jgi:hypothetical protein